MGKFGDEVVTVTGAGQETGKKLAIHFYEEGAVVDLLDLDGQNLDAVVGEVNLDIGRFLTYTVDVSDNRQVALAIDDIGKQFGRIDILINNAGVLHKDMVENSMDTHMKLMVDVNLTDPTYCTHASVPYMKENGRNIANVSSILTTFPNAGSGTYGAAKAGMTVLTKVWAAELAPYKICVDCCAPGVLNTPMTEDVTRNRAESKLYQTPLRRFGETDDTFDLVSFFYSDQTNYITGRTIRLDGGMWAIQTSTAAWGL